MLLTAQFCLAMVLGFVLPGYLLAGLFGSVNRWLWAFPLSLVLLFWAVLFVGIVGLPVTALVVSCVLISQILLIAAFHRRKSSPAIPIATASPKQRLERRIILGLCVLIAIFLFRTVHWPLGGNDNAFRWEFLARCILTQHNFRFYPPVSAADYRIYFYTDGIPPQLSFCYWWLYATSGGVRPALTSIFVAAQLAVILCFTYSIGRKLHSPLAGVISAGALGSSTLFIYSLAMGQETGLTALSLAATLDAIVDRKDRRAMILAGLAAALGALSREYGWIIPILGAVAVIWLGGGLRNAAILCATAAIVAMPWYLRNAIHTGNPFYSNRLGPFHVNAMHVAILDFYRNQLGVATWSLSKWASVALNLVLQAPFQFTIGLVAVVSLFRKAGFLAAAAGVFVVLWLDSIGYTSGGWAYAARVLPPALVVLSVPAGIVIAGARRRVIWSFFLAVAMIWSIVAESIYPYIPAVEAFEQWSDLAFSSGPFHHWWWDDLPQMIPRGSRVLCDNAYIQAGLVGSGIDLVPIWSPEVAFLSDPNLPPPVVRRDLLSRGIRYVIVGYDLNGVYLSSQVRFYSQDMRFWNVIVTAGQTYLCKIPAPGDRTLGALSGGLSGQSAGR